MENHSSVISSPIQRLHFTKMYRRLWLALYSVALLWTPVATLGFVGLFAWLPASTALFSWLALFGLALTVYVGGRPDGLTLKSDKKSSDDV